MKPGEQICRLCSCGHRCTSGARSWVSHLGVDLHTWFPEQMVSQKKAGVYNNHTDHDHGWAVKVSYLTRYLKCIIICYSPKTFFEISGDE